MGVTRASFQAVGKDEELSDLLSGMDNGMLSCCAHSLSDNTYVTGFAKTIPNHSIAEIHFIA